jgi:hypothetical protein
MVVVSPGNPVAVQEARRGQEKGCAGKKICAGFKQLFD